MKCKWYDAFEGACANGECPYRGDVCPTSEHPEVCKYYNKPEKKLSVGDIVKGMRVCGRGALCHGCPAQNLSPADCSKALKEQAADMLEKLAAEKDAKKPEWISVEERLPEFNQNVLVYGVGLPKYGFEGQTAIAITSYTNHKYGFDIVGWNEPWQYFSADYKITHWMPLPSTEGLEDKSNA